MDDDEDAAVITQLGLLLTQVRYARMALDGIENATSRYAGLSLTVAASGSTPWGAPPMVDGALKVYVVNIGDLTSGNSIGDVVGGVIGGVGRFLGGFTGGLVGGTVSGVLWPWVIHSVSRILDRVERILNRWGTAARTPAEAVQSGGAAPPPGPPTATIAEQLQSVSVLVRELGALFTAAGSGDGKKTEGGEQGGGITAALQPAVQLATAATHLVDGLILLVPMLVGALASLLSRIDLIQLKVLDLMEFALRAALLLRAAVLGTVLDTIALVGRLAATTLGLVVTALDAIIPSVFRIVLAALDTALTALQIASTGLKNVIDGLMLWLRDGLGAMLVFVGNLRVFRLVEHLVQIAPALLAAVARLMGTPLSPPELAALTRASRTALPRGSGAPSVPVPIPGAPDVAALALPPTARADLRASIGRLGTVLATETRTSLSAVQGALGGIGSTFRGTVDHLDDRLGAEIGLRSKIAAADVSGLTTAIGAAREAARSRPDTGLEQITKAYETWLNEGGMRTLLERITDHFRAAPTQGPDAATSLPGRTLRAVETAVRDRAVVVEIGEVVLDLGTAPAPAPTAQPVSWNAFDPDDQLDHQRELADRGWLQPA